MERFKRSWELAKQSLAVLRSNPQLAAFPIISGIASIVVSVSFILPVFLTLQAGGAFKNPENLHASPWHYLVSFAYYLVSYFVVVFFNVGLIHCANETLCGRNATFGEGINMAIKRLGPILGWSLLAATIGTVLKAISERMGIVGQIVIALIGGAWNIVTFFTLPMLALEGVGPIEAVKGSWTTIKKVWGEAIIGNVGISTAIGILGLIPIPIIVLSAFSQSFPIIGIAVVISILFWIALGTIGACLTGIYNTATFHYARTGEVPAGFDSGAMQNAFMPKPDSTASKFSNFIRPK
ncbi:MAG: DUF6159 family protein [Armatimonadetes bacterium]|nr:DUF6159 family protein [Armatimonadota bacterium]